MCVMAFFLAPTLSSHSFLYALPQSPQTPSIPAPPCTASLRPVSCWMLASLILRIPVLRSFSYIIITNIPSHIYHRVGRSSVGGESIKGECCTKMSGKTFIKMGHTLSRTFGLNMIEVPLLCPDAKTHSTDCQIRIILSALTYTPTESLELFPVVHLFFCFCYSYTKFSYTIDGIGGLVH